MNLIEHLNSVAIRCMLAGGPLHEDLMVNGVRAVFHNFWCQVGIVALLEALADADQKLEDEYGIAFYRPSPYGGFFE